MCPFDPFGSKAQKGVLGFSNQSTKHHLYFPIYNSKGTRSQNRWEIRILWVSALHCVGWSCYVSSFCSLVVKSSFHSPSRERGVQCSAYNFEEATLYLRACTSKPQYQSWYFSSFCSMNDLWVWHLWGPFDDNAIQMWNYIQLAQLYVTTLWSCVLGRFSSAMVLHGGTELVYLMALGLYRLVCLHILTKVEIWSGDTDPWLTDRLWQIELLSSWEVGVELS